MKSIDKAKNMAKAQSLRNESKDITIYIIYCNRTENYYVDTNGLIRHWEQLIGYYINGVFTSEK